MVVAGGSARAPVAAGGAGGWRRGDGRCPLGRGFGNSFVRRGEIADNAAQPRDFTACFDQFALDGFGFGGLLAELGFQRLDTVLPRIGLAERWRGQSGLRRGERNKRKAGDGYKSRQPASRDEGVFRHDHAIRAGPGEI
ncbi:MAG: hypothetical protein WDM79_18055 [Terricaulis sp.]